MKIIIVDRLNYSYGGTQAYTFSLAKVLSENGHAVKIYNGLKLLNIEEAHHIDFVSPKWTIIKAFNIIYSFPVLFRSLKLFTKFKPDIIHINNLNHQVTPSVIHAAKLCKIPIVYTLHDYKLVCNKYKLIDNQYNLCNSCKNGKYCSILKKKCTINGKENYFQTLFLFIDAFLTHKIIRPFRFVDTFISPSQYLSNVYKSMGFPYKIQVIPNFVFSPSEPNIPLKISSAPKIIYFGRFEPEKGLNSLCKSISELSVHLDLIGAGSQFKYIKKISQTNKNISVIPFTSNKHKLQNLIKTHHFSILPSIWPENTSISMLESLSLGIPVIGTNLGGTSEVIKNNKNGFIYDPNKPSSLRHVLNKIINLNDNNYRSLADNAYETYKKMYNPKIHYKKIISLYSNLTR